MAHLSISMIMSLSDTGGDWTGTTLGLAHIDQLVWIANARCAG